MILAILFKRNTFTKKCGSRGLFQLFPVAFFCYAIVRRGRCAGDALANRAEGTLSPVCGEILETVPEEWKPGMPLHGLQCPANFEHYMLVIEDENAMREMRRRMAARAKKS
ncbi:hypothetical protein [Achromobacter xylosoxidans]|uniref:hypothetical protein n=1 Tax=Alcaligenes xylosoxydans xylosoxydans TaxID=85698 RepID=UPI001041741E|nr:hypothetical protein [Achromobacter xylosoxidans]